MTMAIIDVDHFKEVNDQFGHNVGDLVLKEVATALTGAFESEGVPYRIGGDEFVVLMYGSGAEMRADVERRVRNVATKLISPHDDLPAIGISAGVAFGDGTQVKGELYKHADEALYRVKAEGRHGLAFADEDAITPFGE